ncbi:MAG: hypothetical protein M3Q23_09745 [Actinomycetota bacterium]|nr:hypothetical protein [Actinomycetota bacterium]
MPTPSATPLQAGAIDVSSLPGRIAFASGTADVYVVNADGSHLRQLTANPANDFDPSWSPDGKRIAFRSERDGNNEIYVMNADGSAQRNVSLWEGDDWGPAWSPDGRWIAFNSARPGLVGLHLYLASPDGALSLRVAHRYVEYPAWSADGTKISFMSPARDGAYDIFVMDADGTDVRQLTHSPGPDGWPAWSPDGRQIVFASVRDDCSYSSAAGCKTSGDVGPYHTLWIMNADGSNQHRLTDVFGQFAVWSPDGRYILFAPGLSVIRPDGTGLARIEVGAAEPEMPDWTAA